MTYVDLLTAHHKLKDVSRSQLMFLARTCSIIKTMCWLWCWSQMLSRMTESFQKWMMGFEIGWILEMVSWVASVLKDSHSKSFPSSAELFLLLRRIWSCDPETLTKIQVELYLEFFRCQHGPTKLYGFADLRIALSPHSVTLPVSSKNIQGTQDVCGESRWL